MYLIEYTVIAGGKVEQIKGTDHADAVGRYVKDSLYIWGNDGQYEAADGEKIVVVGPLQEDFAEREWYRHRQANIMAETGKSGKDGERARKALNRFQQKPEPEAPSHVVTFKVNHVMRREIEYVEGLPEQEDSETPNAA